VRVMPGGDRCRWRTCGLACQAGGAQVGSLDFYSRRAIILHKTEGWLDICAIRGLRCERRFFA
jgi:hypothetical protein